MKQPAKALSSLLERHLNAYTLAAAAAGVGALCFAQPAEGKIVYTPANVKISPDRGTFWLDVNHDGIPDFGLSNQYSGSGRFFSAMLNVAGLSRSNEIPAQKKGVFGFYAFALSKGAKIGASAGFHSAYGYRDVMGRVRDSEPYGYWQGGTAYLGLEFMIKGKVHFGWARVKVAQRAPHGFNATLTGYAYETIANKAIAAGATKGDVVTVQPTTLGGLAEGRR